MTKHYHITPEQALEIANNKLPIGETKYKLSEMGVEMLADCFNTALSELLGEPVSIVELELSQDGKCGRIAWFESTQSRVEGTNSTHQRG